MESRSETCIFVGYPKETKGYYLYSPSDLKVFVSTNAKFLEKDYMNDFVARSCKDSRFIDWLISWTNHMLGFECKGCLDIYG